MLSPTKSRLSADKAGNAGKRLLFLSILFSLVCFCSTSNAQELVLVSLDQDDGLLANPSRVVLSPGDTLQFNAVNGDFDIYIVDAINIFKIKEADIKIRINSSTTPLSEKYVVRAMKNDDENSYSLYCISSNTWPDAPPRIIIVSQ
jgi:hypothetical protein